MRNDYRSAMNNGDNCFAWYTSAMDAEEQCPFKKVIFLDVDGVLNDEGKNYDSGVLVDETLVANLKSIVDATGATIILSSSWRYSYKDFLNDGLKTRYKGIELLHTMLQEAGLQIKGLTPFSQESGPAARPLEIREWLRRFHQVDSYVILDDDTFWEWGFLQRNVVTTQTLHPENPELMRYVRGLTCAHAEKAIAILNDEGAMKLG